MNRASFAVFVFMLLPAAALDARAAAPTTSPAIPPLVVGERAPGSFVVEGIFRFSKTGGLAFRVAAEGEKQFCALYDPADGTPLFLSDGQQTLVYDLANSRIVRVAQSRGYVRVDWNAEKAKPLSFGFAVDRKSDPEKLAKANAWFQIDRFVAAMGPALKRLDAPADVELFAVERQGGSIDSIRKNVGDAASFRFTSTVKGQDFSRLELEARNIGEHLPDSELAFPEVKRLGQDVAMTEADQLLEFLALLSDGRAWMGKLALAGGGEAFAAAKKEMPDVDWDELRRRDAKFGEQYRAALARQGVRFAKYKSDAAAQPTR
jgi:hypothetical protein